MSCFIFGTLPPWDCFKIRSIGLANPVAVQANPKYVHFVRVYSHQLCDDHHFLPRLRPVGVYEASGHASGISRIRLRADGDKNVRWVKLNHESMNRVPVRSTSGGEVHIPPF